MGKARACQGQTIGTERHKRNNFLRAVIAKYGGELIYCHTMDYSIGLCQRVGRDGRYSNLSRAIDHPATARA